MKKFTSIIVSIVCFVVLMAGCSSAPANAEQPKAEDTQQEAVESTSKSEASESSETKESSEATETPEAESTSGVVVPDYKISGWSIKGKGEGDSQVAYLAHRTGVDPVNDVEEAYVFDSESGIEADECTVVAKNEQETLFLLHQHRNFYTFDLSSNELKCIVEGYLDYYYDEDSEKLFYLDIEYREHEFDWQNSDSAVETGNMHTAYIRGEYFPVENDNFSDTFTAIQDAVKSGEDPKSIKGVEIMENGDIYDLNGKYLANIHFPAAYRFAPNLQFDERGMEILMNGNMVQYYRYGELIQEFELPQDGMWKIIQSEVTYNVDPDELFSKDVELGELESAIAETKILAYNIFDQSVWKVDSTGANQVIQNCVDYQEVNGVLYYIDFSYNSYTLNWLDSNESTEILSGVVAVAHYPDERVGFIIRPDDSRATAKEDGMYIYRP